MPCSTKNSWARYLSPIVRHTSGGGASTSAGASASREAETIAWSRSVSGHDEADVVLRDERRERRDVARVVDTRDERPVVRVVERGRQRVEVGGDGRRAGTGERADDVDALSRAREEHRAHDRGA